MEKLDWYFVEELSNLESLTLVKCCGVVLSVIKEHSFVSFIVSDSTGTLQATLYQDERIYQKLELPERGDSIVAVGQAFKKQFGGENAKFIIKLKLKLFRVISIDQQMGIIQKVLQRSMGREQSQSKDHPKITKTKRPLIKQVRAVVQPLDIRNLILCAVYMTLENNPDLNSYTFSIYTVQKHRLTKSFLEAKKLREESIDYLGQFISNQLKYLVQVKLIQEKEEIEGTKVFKVSKKLFTQMEMRILGLINEHRNKQGITSSDLVHATNRQLGFISEKNYAFSENLIHKVLRKFIEQGKIYKTSEKVLYPNY